MVSHRVSDRAGCLRCLYYTCYYAGGAGLEPIGLFVPNASTGPGLPASKHKGLPLLDPDLWTFWLPLILLLLAAEAAFEVVKYRIGRWTFALATLNVVLGALFAAPVVYLAATDRLLNPSAVAEIQKGWAGFDAATVNTVVVIVSLAIWVWDGVDGWRRTVRA